MTEAVIGLGYGDEGKGNFVQYLTKKNIEEHGTDKEDMIIVRFSGCQNAGHNVIFPNGNHHCFSQFGSGSYYGVQTFISEKCTFLPSAFLEERELLKEAMRQDPPKVIINSNAMLTCTFDILDCIKDPLSFEHGTTAMGVHKTKRRHSKNFKLFVRDMLYPSILKQKLLNIANYYYNNCSFIPSDLEDYIDKEIEEITKSLQYIEIENILADNEENFLDNLFSRIIFEGSQGTLLDEEYGFYPNVTHSKTSVCAIPYSYINQVYLITRCYHTRHGNGYFTSSNKGLHLMNSETERNSSDSPQGEFRIAPLDEELLDYALNINFKHSDNFDKANLVVTCMDQVVFDLPSLLDKLKEKRFEINEIYTSYGPKSDDIKLFLKN